MSDTDTERLLRERKAKKKQFDRQNSHKFGRVPSSWRKARGKHSNVRLEKKYAKNKPKVGYRTPKAVRGLHPSGYEDILVHRPADLDELDPETQAARIGSTVGGRKREQILEKAEEHGITVLNGEQDE
ncbi:MAG: 50S ribosomal protein L32e [Candidatus Nanohaloarchaeota archaeon QJJ-5]|nr:50S ribosomal protein L32e [Candidatus Nanohaloarchaeota archaeon QJJ-5]